MLKNLIFLSLLVFSLQIQNCRVSIKVCKGCKTGNTLANLNDPEDIDCIKNELLGNANDNCLYYSDPDHTYCSKCKNGFEVDGLLECGNAPRHCDYMHSNQCTHCTSYYNLTNGQCTEMKCKFFDNGKWNCKGGYYPIDNKECKRIPIAHCIEGNTTYCEDCEHGYYLNGNKECKKITFEHCKDGNSTHCEDCEYGYYLKGTKECKKIPIDHCEEGNEEECDNCEDGYYEKDGRCNKKIDHCSKMDSDTKCSECKQSYDLNEDHTACEYLCTSTEEYCDECNVNYYTVDGKTCVVIDPDYKPEDIAKNISFDFAAFVALLFLIL